MADPRIPIPDGSLRVETIGQLQDWNEDKIRRHFRGQVDNMITDLIEKLKAGVFGRLSDVFRGVSPPGMGDFFDQVWLGLSGNLSDALSNTPNLDSRLTPIRDAARGLIAPVVARMDAVEESQLTVEEQLGLLDGVRGFAYAVQANNVNTRNGDNGVVQLPLTQWGVSKGAYVTREGIVIQEPGVWQINAFVSGRQTIAVPGLGQQDTTVFTFEGVPGMPPPRVVGEGGTGSVTINASFVVRISSPTTIKFWAGSARWRYFEGGTQYSNFSVIKHDSRLGDAPPGTVPDA